MKCGGASCQGKNGVKAFKIHAVPTNQKRKNINTLIIPYISPITYSYSKIIEQKKCIVDFNVFLVTLYRQLLHMQTIHCARPDFATGHTSHVVNMEKIFSSVGVVLANKNIVKDDQCSTYSSCRHKLLDTVTSKTH